MWFISLATGSAALLGMTAAAFTYSYFCFSSGYCSSFSAPTQVQRLPFLMLDVITGRPFIQAPET